MGGDGGGGDGGFAQRQQAEEARKTGLRSRINQLYGYDDPEIASAGVPTRERFTSGATPGQFWSQGDYQGYDPGDPGRFDEAAYTAALQSYSPADPDPAAKAARDAAAREENDLADANRTFYSEDLQHNYDRAKRSNTFALADRGLLGGSAQIDTEGELSRDNTLGATRLEDEVRAAVASLRGQREGERLNAMQLVNSGAGEDAVAGAQAGLSRALQNSASTRKASIAGDLFTTGADSISAGNDATTNALAIQRYQNQLRTFFGNQGSGKGTVTGTNF